MLSITAMPHCPASLLHVFKFVYNSLTCYTQLDAPVVSKAFLNHDLATLKLHCGPELVERFSGIFRHFSEQVSASLAFQILSFLLFSRCLLCNEHL